MILQSLVNYYEILAKANVISKPGYGIAKVAFALSISKDGQLVGILPLKQQVQRGKKNIEIAKEIEVPEQVKKSSGITSNFLCENSSYMLGIDSKGKPERSKDCFKAFSKLHDDVLKDVNCIQSEAILKFLSNWNPEDYEENIALHDYLEDILTGVNLVFFVEGIGFAHECQEIKEAWEKFSLSTDDAVEMQCLITGEKLPATRLHQSFKGIKGAQSTGASIVSFNARSFESFGRDEQQGLNAPISEYASFAYATALKFLLADDIHRQTFGDSTVVFWADRPERVYQDLFSFSLNPTEKEGEREDDKNSTMLVNEVFKKISTGTPISELNDAFDPETNFNILGLSPNAGRLSIRFFVQNSFGSILEKVMKHYKDMEIEKASFESEFIPLWKLMLETVSPNSRDKASSPLLSGAVLRAILTGTQYPVALFNSIIIRIRAEKDINFRKVSAIKAYLIRKYSNGDRFKEVLTVSLNAQSENRPYVLGRLFAVLEKAQQDANPGINTTIKDRYFTSACATPSSVFPVLLRLSNHHISKSEYGYVSDNRIRELMDKLDVENNPFPAHLTLEEQGIFILGYYHQQKANYEKINKEVK